MADVRRAIGVALWLAMGASVAAPLSEAERDAQVMRIAGELRCLVCQNQSVADSQAALALQLKDEVRAQLRQGRSEDEILDFMAKRYGDSVRYAPPLRPSTWLLWFGPLGLLAGGLGLFALHTRARRRRATPLAQAPQGLS